MRAKLVHFLHSLLWPAGFAPPHAKPAQGSVMTVPRTTGCRPRSMLSGCGLPAHAPRGHASVLEEHDGGMTAWRYAVVACASALTWHLPAVVAPDASSQGYLAVMSRAIADIPVRRSRTGRSTRATLICLGIRQPHRARRVRWKLQLVPGKESSTGAFCSASPHFRCGLLFLLFREQLDAVSRARGERIAERLVGESVSLARRHDLSPLVQ